MRRAVVAAVIAVTPLAASPARAAQGIGDLLGPSRPKAAAIYDVKEQRFLDGYRQTRALAPASLLKMLTALVVSDRLLPTNELVISRRAANADADRVIWKQGARFTVDQAMHGLLMESSNGAAYALAERAYGSLARFAQKANEMARSLGATETVLVDPSGLDAPGQRSNAHDLALIAARLLDDPWLREIVALDRYRLPWSDGRTATFNNANPYLARDPSAVGIKHGFTSKAGNTVAAAAERGGRVHIVVVLGGPDPFDQARWFMDRAFEIAPGAPEPVPSEREEGSERTDAAATPVEAAAVTSVPLPMGGTDATPRRADSPTMLRFVVGFGFAGVVLGKVRASRRRARRRAERMRRLRLVTSNIDTLRSSWPSNQRSPSSPSPPSSRTPRAPEVPVSQAPAKRTASSGRSRASQRT